MAAAGDDRKPLLVSELGVTSASQLPTGFDWGLEGQATFLRRAYGLLLRSRQRWHIAGVDWYAWRDMEVSDPHCVFCQHAGLLDSAGRPKPAWRAFAHAAAEARTGTVR
jgi:GH35 family endo-1,4-beta-xylanase